MRSYRIGGFLSFVLCIAAGPLYAFEGAEPRLIEPRFPSDEVVIATTVVTDAPYAADPTGVKDCTLAFQRALDDCYRFGGGAVWVPVGRYRFAGSLSIPEGVSLRGDWKRPTLENPAVEGSILMPTEGRGRADARPFLNITGGSGINNLSIYYPDQTIDAPVPYPPTIQTAAIGDGDHTKERACLNINNVTLVNSWFGVDFRYFDDASSVQFPFSRNIFGTPLKTGIRVSRASAFPRTQSVSFSPVFWAGSGLEGAPSLESVRNYLRSHESIGLDINGNGSGDVSGVYIEGYSIGIDYSDQTPGGSNGKLFGSTILGARTAVRIGVSEADIFIVSSSLDASGTEATCVEVSDDAGSGTVFLNDCVLSSTGPCVRNNQNGFGVNIYGCDFLRWGGNEGYAIVTNFGLALIERNRFLQDKDGTSYAIQLGRSVTNAAIMGNVFLGAPKIDDRSDGATSIRHGGAIVEERPLYRLPVQPALPLPLKTDVESLFNVRNYGAKGDGITDDTAALQRALDAARAHGGGTVYLPGGVWTLKGRIRVPAGVELRGAQENPFFANNARSVVLLYGGKGTTEGPAPITLDSSGTTGSGIRGLFFWYPEQDSSRKYTFPPTIRTEGPRCWLINVAIANAYDGVDMGSADSTGHYVNNLAGYASNNLLKISRSSGGGFIANLQTNPTFWKRAFQHAITTFPGPPPADEALQIDETGAALILGNVRDEVLVGCFTHGPRVGIHAQNLDGGGPELTAFNCGGEVFTWLRIDAAGPKGITILNSTWHTNDRGPTGKGEPYLIVGSGVSSSTPIRLLSCMNWADTAVGMLVQGGDVLLRQYQTRLRKVPYAERTVFARVEGGELTIEAARFTKEIDTHVELEGSGRAALIGSVGAGGIVSSADVAVDGQPDPATATVIDTARPRRIETERGKKDKFK